MRIAVSGELEEVGEWAVDGRRGSRKKWSKGIGNW